MTRINRLYNKPDRYYNTEELLRIIVSGKNPDGTTFILPVEAPGPISVSSPSPLQVSAPSALPISAPTGGLQTTSAAGKALTAQKFYFGGSGRMTLAAAGNLRAVIQNPSSSGRMMYLARLVVFATAVGWATLFINPTTGVPVSVPRPVNNAVIGAATSPVGIVRADTDLTMALSGGTDTGTVIGVEANRRQQIDLPPFVLAAGVTLGINVPFTGAADATLTAYWWEE